MQLLPLYPDSQTQVPVAWTKGNGNRGLSQLAVTSKEWRSLCCNCRAGNCSCCLCTPWLQARNASTTRRQPAERKRRSEGSQSVSLLRRVIVKVGLPRVPDARLVMHVVVEAVTAAPRESNVGTAVSTRARHSTRSREAHQRQRRF